VFRVGLCRILDLDFRELRHCEVRGIPLPRTTVNKGNKKEGRGVVAPVICAFAVHSPTRLALPRSSKPDDTISGLVRTNVNLEPSEAMNIS
jgi:hypothetical protein